MTTHAQWQAWIGPRWREKGAAGTTAWTDIADGTLSPETAATTLAASMASGDTDATLTSAGSWPSDYGWAWIGPNGSGQAWEYIDYTARSGNALSGITRESTATREHNGAHTAGAVARLFWPLTTNDGNLTISIQTDDALAAETWSAQIAGVVIPPAAVRNEHLIAITYRDDPADSYQLYLVGWLQAPTTRDDYQQRADWTVQIVSAAGLIADQIMDGIRAGDLDLARSGSASADTDLADPRKEAGSGDYVAANPGLTAANLNDGDPNTLWIGERVIGTPDTSGYPGDMVDAHFISQAFIYRWTGDTRRSRWLELLCKGQKYPNALLCNSTGAAAFVQFNGVQAEFGDRIILCEDRATFEADHPLAEALKVIEIDPLFFDALSLTDDTIGIHFALSDVWTHSLMWGSPANDQPLHDNDPGDDQYGETWPGPGVTAPTPGQVIRYQYNAAAANRAGHFVTDYAEHAGYTVDDGTDPWARIDLPGLGLALAEDVTAVSPAAAGTLKITDDAGTPSTAGLPSSGTIQIGQEQITYSAKTAAGVTVTARAANGTTAAAHVEGDTIRILDGSTATDGPPIRRVAWTRRSGGAVPARFYVYRSNQESARNPGDSNYGADYEQIADVSGHSAATWALDLSPARRTRVLLIQFETMSADPARARLNSLEAYADEASYSTDNWLYGGTVTAAGVIFRLLYNAGLPYEIMTDLGDTAELEAGFSTAKAGAWGVAADLADYAGAWIAQDLTGHLTLGASDLWTGTLTPATTWTRSNLRSVEMVQQLSRQVSQVRIAWKSPDGTASGTESYPATPTNNGAPVEHAEALYANATAAQAAAKRRYLASKYAFTFVLDLAEGAPTIRPGETHRLQWQFASDMQQIDRVFIVTAVDHQVSGGQWATVISGVQVDRESYT